jgi:lipoprotein-releasing system permease protein
MYKLLLCWRYLRTRYIALASIISVTLGVATMIVVNSVMEGFTREMQDRIHGILSDVVIESTTAEGFPDPQWHIDHVQRVAGEYIEAITATIQVPALLSFPYGDTTVRRQVQLIGIDPSTQSMASDFGGYLQHPENRQQMSFELRESGYDVVDHQGGPDARARNQLEGAGWPWRRWRAARDEERRQLERIRQEQAGPQAEAAAPETLSLAADAADQPAAADPFASQSAGQVYNPAVEQATGAVLGIALASFRDHQGRDRFLILPGDDVKLTFPNAGTPPRPVDANFTVVDFYESKMSEYDSTLVFVPLDKLQQLCGMYDPQTGLGYVNALQIKLKDDRHGNLVRDKLRATFAPELYGVSTWKDKQGPLLSAVHMEIALLNILLFLIIAVAGFGILAIFFMIVVEKVRDIGVLKSLGAPSQGILAIFLAYGLSLGLVGSGAGMVLGLLFVWNINRIADLVGKITGNEVFDPTIYYFDKIPTIIEPWTVAWIVVGALAIAVLASVFPARRAARLHPVEALRA